MPNRESGWINIDRDGIYGEVFLKKELEKLANIKKEILFEEMELTSKNIKDQLLSLSPKRDRSNWKNQNVKLKPLWNTYRSIKRQTGARGRRIIIYSDDKYWLLHLLENGTIYRPGIYYIAPIWKKEIAKLLSRLRKRLKEK